jgi:hypothetical protein
MVYQPKNGVVKPQLVTRYQFSVSVLTAAQAFCDQAAIVVAHCLLPISTKTGRGSSRNRVKLSRERISEVIASSGVSDARMRMRADLLPIPSTKESVNWG